VLSRGKGVLEEAGVGGCVSLEARDDVSTELGIGGKTSPDTGVADKLRL
jgi:hypothetical protein